MEDLQRRTRDENGKSILVPQDMTYEEWDKEYRPKLILEQGTNGKRKEKMNWQEQNEILRSTIIKPMLHSNKSVSYRVNKYQNAIMNLYRKNGNENMCLLDLKTGRLIGNITEGEKRTTVGTDTITAMKLLARKKKSVIAIHNHPENYSFSLTDIKSFNKIKKIDTMILLTDDYRYYLKANNTNKYSLDYLNKLYRGIEKQINKTYNYLNGIEKRDLTNQRFFQKVGWIYEKEKN